jgi:hypothetical protein
VFSEPDDAQALSDASKMMPRHGRDALTNGTVAIARLLRRSMNGHRGSGGKTRLIADFGGVYPLPLAGKPAQFRRRSRGESEIHQYPLH